MYIICNENDVKLIKNSSVIIDEHKIVTYWESYATICKDMEGEKFMIKILFICHGTPLI